MLSSPSVSSDTMLWCTGQASNSSRQLITALDWCYPRILDYFHGANDQNLTMTLTIPILVRGFWNHVQRNYGYDVGMKIPAAYEARPPVPNDDALIPWDMVDFGTMLMAGYAWQEEPTDASAVSALQFLNQTVTKQLGLEVSSREWAVAIWDPLRNQTAEWYNEVLLFLPLRQPQQSRLPAAGRAGAARHLGSPKGKRSCWGKHHHERC
jgi:hypothetical protein